MNEVIDFDLLFGFEFGGGDVDMLLKRNGDNLICQGQEAIFNGSLPSKQC